MVEVASQVLTENDRLEDIHGHRGAAEHVMDYDVEVVHTKNSKH